MERGHSSTKLTYADYELLPDDGLRHEIIGGEHFVTPSPVTRHQRISRNLAYLLEAHLRTFPVGELFYAPFDVVLSESDIVVPDLVYVSHQRSSRIGTKNLQGAPDLVVEILSSGTRKRDERLKRELYERAGVDEYWLVDPDPNRLVVYARRGAAFRPPAAWSATEILTTPLLPGLEVPLAKVFV